MTTEAPALSWTGRVARAVSLLMFAYWGLYALLAPVTNIDSQMYNLARLELALRGGLFANPYFTSVFHVMHPWGFDAVHLPFMALGWGYALPSYACLVGTCWIAFTLVRARLGVEAAWAAVVALLSLTCLVYQGTSTKNDIPLLFAGAVWVYGRWRWRREGGAIHLFWMIVALGFMAGAKTTGVLFAFLLGLWMLWEVRGEARLRLKVAGGLVAAALFLGSVETYVETYRLFGKPLGPDSALAMMKNRDGAAGGVANLSRHLARGVYLGPTTFDKTQPAAAWLSDIERSFLRMMGWEDKGNAAQFRDEHLYLHQSGFEEFSGFGPVGTIALAVMLVAVVRWRPRALWWRLAIAGLTGFVLVSCTVAYTDWANRYLIPFYALGTAALVVLLWETANPVARRLRVPVVAIASVGAMAAPLLSFNRGPEAMVAAVGARERLETKAYPLAGEVRQALRRLKAAAPESRIFFVACNDSIILPVLRDRLLDAKVVTPGDFDQLISSGYVRSGDLVVEDCASGSKRLFKVAEVSAPDHYAGRGERRQAIHRVEGDA